MEVDRDCTASSARDITARFDADAPFVVLLRHAGDALRSAEERRADGRRLVIEAAAALLGIDPSEVTVTARCAHCGGDHGRPLVSIDGRPGALDASVSHADGATVAAVADRVMGIDLEPIAGGSDRFVAIRAVSGPWAAEVADGADALRAWTTVEAVVKADGRGLEIDPRRVRLTGRPGELGTTASIDGAGPLYAVSSAVVDGCVVTLALGEAVG